MTSQIAVASRFTTEFSPQEDRIRLCAQLAGSVEIFWFSHRMLRRLLPVLAEWLEKNSPQGPLKGSQGCEASILSSSSSAEARQTPLPEPVRAEDDAVQWLVVSVDVQRDKQNIHLILKASPSHKACLSFTCQSLQQWLGIMMGHYLSAEWPMDIWPVWLTEHIPGRQCSALH